jgi:hypothetical protein
MPEQSGHGIHFGSGKPVKASIWNEDRQPPAKVVDCLFNPTDYTFAKRNEWASGSPTGGDVPLVNFSSGGAMNLEVQLLFDTLTMLSDGPDTTPQDVREYTEKVLDLMKIDPNTADQSKGTPGRPPRVSFRWGRFWSFKSVLTSVSQNFTLFWDDGRPIRATLTASFQQVESEGTYPPQNPTSMGRPQKVRTVLPGETLDAIAFTEYGDASRWRAIADFNRLDNPLRLRVGQQLGLPPLR